MTRKQQFMSDFDSNKDRKTLWVSISLPECPEPEVINNPRANFEAKRAYYDRAYDVAVGARGQMSKQQWSDVAKRIYEVSGIKIDDSVKYK